MKARPQPQHDAPSLQLFLRIKHPSMDPREMTRILAIEPEQTITAGTVVSGGVHRLHSESYWIAELPGTSAGELIENPRAGVQDLSMLGPKRDEVLALRDATVDDIRILLRLKTCGVDTHHAFLQQVNREGGSVALLVNREGERAPFTIKRALAKLAQLGIELEID
jgi:hypothetical protein